MSQISSGTYPCPGCQKQISINKRLCLDCERIESLRKHGSEVKSGATHIMLSFPSKNHDELYRADGMLLGVRQLDSVHFGNDIANHQTRRFISWEDAKKWLRRVADLDLIAQEQGRCEDLPLFMWNYMSSPAKLDLDEILNIPKAVIEERDAESLLVMPGNHGGVDFSKLTN